MIGGQGKTDIGIRDVVGEIHGHRRSEPVKRSIELPHPYPPVHGSRRESFILKTQFSWDRPPYRSNFVLEPPGIFSDIFIIQIQYQFLGELDFFQTSLAHKSLDCLRHAAYYKVLAEVLHHHAMVDRFKGLFPEIAILHQFIRCRPSDGPEEFLEIKRKHLDLKLFAWNDDTLHIPLDGNQRSCLDIMESPIRDKILDGLACPRETLNLVKDYQCLSANQFNASTHLKHHEEFIKISQPLLEQLLDGLRGIRKINDQVMLVFSLRELLDNITLADATGTFNQQGTMRCFVPLPPKKPIVDFSLHRCTLYQIFGLAFNRKYTFSVKSSLPLTTHFPVSSQSGSIHKYASVPFLPRVFNPIPVLLPKLAPKPPGVKRPHPRLHTNYIEGKSSAVSVRSILFVMGATFERRIACFWMLFSKRFRTNLALPKFSSSCLIVLTITL